MRIYHNIPALTAYNSLNATSNAMQKSIEKLSTGLRINSAADDAAGFAISEKMRAQISGMEMAQRNAQDGISMLQTAEGALGETHSILQRMRELAVQAANDTLTQEDRSYIQLEVDELKNQVDNIANTTQFNKKRLLDGSCAGNWSSNDLRVKAYVRGSLREVDQFGQKSAFEGNFKVRIEASATGSGEVQKTSIFKIKHPNVINNVSVNKEAGAEAIRVDNIPAGSYEITTDTIETTDVGTGTYSGTLTTAAISGGASDAGTTATITISDSAGTIEINNIALTSGEANANTVKAAIIAAAGTSKSISNGGLTLTVSGDTGSETITVSSTNAQTVTVTVQDNATAPNTMTGLSAPTLTEETTPTPQAKATLTGSYGFSSSETTVYNGKLTPTNFTIDGVTTATTGTITVTLTADDGTTSTKTTGDINISNTGAVSASDIVTALTTLTLDGLTVTEDNGTVTMISTKGDITLSVGGDLTSDAISGFATTEQTISSLDTMLTKTLDPSVKNNASILFEVTSVNSNSVTLKASSNVLKADGTVENHVMTDIIVDANGTAKLGSLLGLSGDDESLFTFQLDAATSAANFQTGNKFVYNITGGDSDATTAVKISGTQDMDWPEAWGSYDGAQVINSHDGDNSDDVLTFNINGDDVANREIHFRNFYLNENNGTSYEGDIVITTNKNAITPGTTLASFDAAYIGKIATGDTCLRDLDKFWNSQGVFLLEDPQTLTITQGDGKSATVTLYATDTLNDLRNKLNNAIANDLGQGQYVKSDANKFVTFVEDAEVSGFETVQGTFLIRSIIPGSAGSLTFSGDEDFINAFATNIVNKGTETTFTASLYDAHSGAALATGVTVTGNKLIGVLHENVDIEFDALADIQATWSDVDKNFILSSSGGYEAVIHLTDSSTIFQTGANEGEDMAIDIGNMSAAALGIKGVNVTTRVAAMKAVGDLDSAITQVSRQRAKIGAYQNALEWTSENLSTTATNLTAAESRIRDADMAKEMMEFVKLQILNQSGTSMLAQANQLPQQVLSLLQ